MNTLLERQAHIAIPTVLILYIILQGGLFYLRTTSSSSPPTSSFSSFCREEQVMPVWVQVVNFAAASCLSANAALQLYFSSQLFFRKTSGKYSLMVMHLSIFCVHGISASSMYLSHFSYPGGFCKDALGVYSNASQWSEWVTTVPFLAYLSCSGMNKERLGLFESLVMLFAALMISLGFMLIISPKLAWICLIISISCVTAMRVCLRFISSQHEENLLSQSSFTTNNNNNNNKSTSSLLTSEKIFQLQVEWRKRMLSRLLMICPYFTLVYLLSLVGLLSPPMTITGFIMGSMLGKFFFSASLAEGYLELHDEITSLRNEAEKSDEARKSFLRYVFHEIRGPLNTLSMGMQVFEEAFASHKGKNDKEPKIDRDELRQRGLHRSPSPSLQSDSMKVNYDESEKAEQKIPSKKLKRWLKLQEELEAMDEFTDHPPLLTSAEDCPSPSLRRHNQIPTGKTSNQEQTEQKKRNNVEKEVVAVVGKKEEKSRGHSHSHSHGDNNDGPQHKKEGEDDDDDDDDAMEVNKIDHQIFQAMQNATSTLVETVNQVLSLHKIRSGEVTLAERVFDIQGWLQDSIDEALPLLKEKDVTLTWGVSPTIPQQLLGDPERLQTVLNSVVSNLRGCMKNSGNIHIDLTSTPPSDFDKRCVQKFYPLSISDKLVGNEEGKDEEEEEEDKESEDQNCFTALFRVLRFVVDVFFSSMVGKRTRNKEPQNHLATLYLTISSSEFKLSSQELHDLCDPSQLLNSSSLQTGLGLVLAGELISMQEYGSMFFLDSSSEDNRQAVCLKFALPIIPPPVLATTAVSTLNLDSKGNVLSLSNSDERLIGVCQQTRWQSISVSTLESLSISRTDSRSYSKPMPEVRTIHAPSIVEDTIDKSADIGRKTFPSFSSFDSATLSSVTTLPENTRSWNALVVDDTPSNSKILAAVLSKKGHVCTIAKDGEQAVNIVREKGLDAFDIIFMDHTMPIMTGVEATEELRRMGFNRPILGVTGNVLDDDLLLFLQAGADTVLMKPLRLKEIDIVTSYFESFGMVHDNTRRFKIVGSQLFVCSVADMALAESGDLSSTYSPLVRTHASLCDLATGIACSEN